MYGGYSIGEPAHPAARAGRVGRHERPDRKNAAVGIAIAIVEFRAIEEPGIVHLDPALTRVAGEQDEMLVPADADLGHDWPAGIELGKDRAQVGPSQPEKVTRPPV